MKVALYTAVIGGIDAPRPMPKGETFDTWLFTDAPQHDPKLADHVVPRPAASVDPRLHAKYFKMFPHVVLDHDYDASIWIDGSAEILCDPDEFVAMALERLPLGLWAHPNRNDIWEEVEASRGLEKYNEFPLERQALSYAPKNLDGLALRGLWATGVIVRDHRVAAVRKLMDDWWFEILKWSAQDQISLPYVLAKNDIQPARFPGNLWTNEYIRWHLHEHQR